MVSTLRSLSSTFVNLPQSASESRFLYVSGFTVRLKEVIACSSKPTRHLDVLAFFYPDRIRAASRLPPAMLPFSISSFECSFCPRSDCHREHKLFSLGRSDTMIGVYKQSYQAGMTCTHLPCLPLPRCTHEICPSSFCYCWGLSGVSVPLRERGYTGRCTGNPGPAHYPAPLRHSSWKLGHQMLQAC